MPEPPDRPPPAPRPFRLRAVDAVSSFLLLFGGIWMTVGGMLTIMFAAVGGPFAGLYGLAPLGFAFVGAIVFGLGMRRVLRVRRIYVHGEPARAEVTAVSPTAMRINRRRVMRVDYAFDTIMGRMTGRTSAVIPPPLGSQLWILHLPSEPKRNVAA